MWGDLMSRRIMDATQTKTSRLITAIDAAMTQFEKSQLPKNSQFGFKTILQTPYVVLENGNVGNNYVGFDFTFNIPFDDDMVANEAEIEIYNLTDSTINKFKTGNSITIKAGYGNDLGVVFQGYISKVKTVREGVERKTTINALDDVKYTPQMMSEKTYAKGTRASTILKDLLGRLGLPIEVFSIKRDFTYTEETKVDGSITENIKNYSDVCGVSTYIHKQRIYCRPLSEGDNLYFNVNSNTGMIDSPEPFEEENTKENYVDKVYGYEITMILQHRLCTAGIVNVDSISYSGEYRVQSGTHSYDGLSATTKFKCIEKTVTTIEEKK